MLILQIIAGVVIGGFILYNFGAIVALAVCKAIECHAMRSLPGYDEAAWSIS